MTLTIPNTISNGTAGDASEVEANFAAIESYVNASVAKLAGATFTGAVVLPAADPTADNEATRKLYVDTITPAGVMVEFGGAAAPAGWLLCNGAAVSRATYARLFTALGTAWGVGDGATTFNVPDRRDRVAVGKGTAFPTLAATGGQTTIPAHTHTNDHNHPSTTLTSSGTTTIVVQDPTSGSSVSVAVNPSLNAYNVNANAFSVDLPNYTGLTGSTGTGANNMNPYVVVNHIIKV